MAITYNLISLCPLRKKKLFNAGQCNLFICMMFCSDIICFVLLGFFCFFSCIIFRFGLIISFKGISIPVSLAQLAGAAEYTNCKGVRHPQ